MPILLSELLNQINNNNSSHDLTAKQAHQLFKGLILNLFRKKEFFVLKPFTFSSIDLLINSLPIKLSTLDAIAEIIIPFHDGEEETNIKIRVEQAGTNSTISFQLNQEKENKFDLTSLSLHSIDLMIKDKSFPAKISSTKSVIPSTTILLDGEEKEITLDVNMALRLCCNHHLYQTIPLSSYENIVLSRLTIEIFEDNPFENGGMALLHLSTLRCSFNMKEEQFICKKNQEKVLRRAIFNKYPINIPTDITKAVVAQLNGKNNTARGLYWLSNEDTKENIIISPYIVGFSLEKYINSDDHKKELADIPGKIKDWVLILFTLLARIHQTRHVHRDIKPENIMIRKKDNALIIIDCDFLCSIDEMVVLSGTPQYIPWEILNVSPTQVSHPNPYQDIFGALIISMMLLKPSIYAKYQELANEFVNAYYSDGTKLYESSVRLLNFYRKQAKQDNLLLLKQVIAKAFASEKPISAKEIIIQLIETDQEMANIAASKVVYSNTIALEALSKIIDVYYQKDPYCRDYPNFPEERKNLSQYLTECLTTEKTYSDEYIAKRFGKAEFLIEACINYNNKNAPPPVLISNTVPGASPKNIAMSNSQVTFFDAYKKKTNDFNEKINRNNTFLTLASI